jgi:hypothetical protein
MSRSAKAGLAVVVATVLGASGAAAVAQTSEPCEDPYTCPADDQVEENEPAVLGAVSGPPTVLPTTSPAPAVVAQPTFTG